MGGVEETRAMGGERAKPLAGGEGERATAEEGGMEGAGARLLLALIRVAVDGARAVAGGVPPARRTKSLIRPSRSLRRRPSIPTPQLRPHQIPSGVHQVPRGAHQTSLWTRLPIPGAQRATLGARLPGVLRTIPGVPQMKPYRANIQAVLAPVKGRERKGIAAFRAEVGRVGARLRTLKPPPVYPRLGEGEEAGETLLRLSLRLSVSPKVTILNLAFLFTLSPLPPERCAHTNLFLAP